jgi:hypothetical protein
MSDAIGSGGSVQIPYWQSSSLADEFIKMTYDTGWVSGDIDWPKWMNTDEAKAFFANPATITTATAEQLQLLLTTIIRSDRFCEGAMLQAFQDGLILAAADRANRLLSMDT